MSKSIAGTERESRVARVVDYIFSHPGEDLSREALAGVAHYSPEHLPKLFKQLVGETLKQYSLRLRLEMAFHRLIVDPGHAVGDIGLDCGFTSPAVFSRAMKGYFGISPEEIRRLPHGRQMRLLHGVADGAGSVEPGAAAGSLAGAGAGVAIPPEIVVVRRPAVEGVYVSAPFNEPAKITEAFAAIGEYSGDFRAFMGILTPHLRNTYRAFVAVSADSAAGAPYPMTRIGGGTYARFTVCGDLRVVNKAAHYFYRRWLPGSGYKIAGIAGFETFDGLPAGAPYAELRRHIHVPVEAVA
jgi:AraC family transcriptional regulator